LSIPSAESEPCTSDRATIPSRSDLLTLLSEACELEHGLACSYLYTAFTLKRELGEGGMTWQQLQLVRKWAAQIYFVASQEMLHLAQVWNLLVAIGGTPYYYRPNFPQGSKYYSFGLPLTLEPFGRAALQRFRYYERPHEISPARQFFSELGVSAEEAASPEYRTVGELYNFILDAIKAIPEEQLFIGDKNGQVGPELVDFPDMVKVIDRASAKEAIRRITHQGEGTVQDRVDCHFGMFTEVLREFEAELTASSGEFQPARNTIENPVTKYRGDYGAPPGNIIEDAYTRRVSDLFDNIYVLMLRTLTYVFNDPLGDAVLLKQFSNFSIALMPTVILPLGEVLTQLPAGKSTYGDKTAGPAFGLSRHVVLPTNSRAATIVVQERLAEILTLAAELASHPQAPTQLVNCFRNLKALSQSIAFR
jgi:hypothetical protein